MSLLSRSAPLFRFSNNGFERWIIIRAEAGDHIIIDGNCVLAPAEIAEADPFVEERRRDLFAQGQFARRAEAGDHVVVDGDFLLAPAELAETDPFVDERIRD
jgi:uncharacterized protein YciI